MATIFMTNLSENKYSNHNPIGHQIVFIKRRLNVCPLPAIMVGVDSTAQLLHTMKKNVTNILRDFVDFAVAQVRLELFVKRNWMLNKYPVRFLIEVFIIS